MTDKDYAAAIVDVLSDMIDESDKFAVRRDEILCDVLLKKIGELEIRIRDVEAALKITGDEGETSCGGCKDRWYVYDEHKGRYQSIDVAFCPICSEPLTEPKPLTLDELRERECKPVWVKRICDDGKPLDKKICDDGWAAVTFPETKINLGYCGSQKVELLVANIWWPGSEVEDTPAVDNYGKTWIAFDHEPKEKGE